MTGVSRFDCYPSDFLNGIIGLTADQIAVYTVVIMLQYDRGQSVAYVGRERELAVRSGLPKGRLIKAVAELVKIGKLSLVDGALENDRCTKELEKIRERISKNVENSLNGGNATKKKWEQFRSENNGANRPTGQPNGMPKQGPNSPPSSLPPSPNNNRGPEPSSGELSLIDKAKTPTPRERLEAVLNPEIAKAVIDHRHRLRKPLTAHAAGLLAAKFAKVKDPNAAAELMIEKGWQSFEPSWIQHSSSAKQPIMKGGVQWYSDN